MLLQEGDVVASLADGQRRLGEVLTVFEGGFARVHWEDEAESCIVETAELAPQRNLFAA